MKRESDTKQKLLSTALTLIWESSYGSISVDDICHRAGVNKGSFYYAFKSKSDLAAAAFEDHWNKKRGLMDEIFSSQVPPLERLEKYCDRVVQDQVDKYQKIGKLCGCPFASIGSELSTQDEQIRKKAHELSETDDEVFGLLRCVTLLPKAFWIPRILWNWHARFSVTRAG